MMQDMKLLMFVYVCACVRACIHACLRVRIRGCVGACLRPHLCVIQDWVCIYVSRELKDVNATNEGHLSVPTLQVNLHYNSSFPTY